MARFVVGDVVAVKFPFSNLRGQKRRPALVVAIAEFGDLILCQITSKPYTSKRAIALTPAHFSEGGLPATSYVRPDKLFTADTSILDRRVGRLSGSVQRVILAGLRRLFAAPTRSRA